MTSSAAFLYSLHKFGMKFGLRNIRLLLRSAGDPHRKFPSVHVAGTNGKGSTSSMIAAIMTAAGYRVGLYTSPHLVRFNERIRINGKMISDKDLARYTRELRPEIERINATFFEATTAIAFKYFADKEVDIAIIETGLGGRLDATNVLHPLVSVITSIGKDHTEQLGNSIKSIAWEKAGIIKRNIPVVVGPLSGSAKNVIRETAQRTRSAFIDSSTNKLPEGCVVELHGQHQLMNAQCAVAAVNILSSAFVVGNKAIRSGLSGTVRYSGLRARQEYLNTRPRILLDAGHNAEGIRTLVAELKQRAPRNIVIIFGIMKDKDHTAVLKLFKTLSPFVVATQPAGDRALSSTILARSCRDLGIQCREIGDPPAALRFGRTHAGKNGLLVITGSHYLLGELLPLLEKKS
jgi:dihydrofolate synthase/folylpolyglutamate synthase